MTPLKILGGFFLAFGLFWFVSATLVVFFDWAWWPALHRDDVMRAMFIFIYHVAGTAVGLAAGISMLAYEETE